MTPEQFCYWLQGRAELDPTPPDEAQWQSIREHLSTVFEKETPELKIPRWPDPQATEDFVEKAMKRIGQRRPGTVRLC